MQNLDCSIRVYYMLQNLSLCLTVVLEYIYIIEGGSTIDIIIYGSTDHVKSSMYSEMLEQIT